MSLDSSVITESQCSCCDGMSECGTSSAYESDCDDIGHTIPVVGTWIKSNVMCKHPPAWYEEYIPWTADPRQSKLNRKTIKRDNRHVIGESLPVIAVSNLRSLAPKLKNFKTDMIEREILVALLSEVWEKTSCKKLQHKLEKMFQLDGLKYISTPRTTKRGGGAAIVVNIEHFSLEKIQVVIPHNLEVVWGLLRPKKTTSKIREMIIGALYFPPN